jgi:phytanoyl-CoA hydroxylase
MLDLNAIIEHYQTHGYARLGALLPSEFIDALAERADAFMLGHANPGLFFQLDAANGDWRDAPKGLGWQGPSLNYRKLEKLERDPLYASAIAHPAFEPLIRALVPGAVHVYRAILFNKGPAGGTELPWHQDGGKLWGLSAEPTVQVWTALDDCPQGGGCLEVAPQTHHRGLATPLGGLVPEAAAADIVAVPLPIRRGESILLHNHLWHRSGKAASGQRRRAFSACYLPSDIHCVRKHKTPRVFPRVF